MPSKGTALYDCSNCMTGRITLSLLSILVLAGCENQPAATGPGGVSADDAQALDQAAAKLDAEAAGKTDKQ